MGERNDAVDTAQFINFIRAIDRAFMFMKILEGTEAGKYLLQKIMEVRASL